MVFAEKSVIKRWHGGPDDKNYDPGVVEQPAARRDLCISIGLGSELRHMQTVIGYLLRVARPRVKSRTRRETGDCGGEEKYKHSVISPRCRIPIQMGLNGHSQIDEEYGAPKVTVNIDCPGR